MKRDYVIESVMNKLNHFLLKWFILFDENIKFRCQWMKQTNKSVTLVGWIKKFEFLISKIKFISVEEEKKDSIQLNETFDFIETRKKSNFGWMNK